MMASEESFIYIVFPRRVYFTRLSCTLTTSGLYRHMLKYTTLLRGMRLISQSSLKSGRRKRGKGGDTGDTIWSPPRWWPSNGFEKKLKQTMTNVSFNWNKLAIDGCIRLSLGNTELYQIPYASIVQTAGARWNPTDNGWITCEKKILRNLTLSEGATKEASIMSRLDRDYAEKLICILLLSEP